MSNGFPESVKQEVLVLSRRHCCLCHKFAGLYTNIHHIQPVADGGPNTLDNAVALCLECHGQVGHYNSRHPIGVKYKPEEVRRQRDAWWDWCKSNAFAPIQTDPVTITPSKILVTGGGDWNTQIAITAFNKSDIGLHDIWIKFHVGLAAMHFSEIVFVNTVSPDCP